MKQFECKIHNRPIWPNIYNNNAKNFEQCPHNHGKNRNICNQCVLWVVNENQNQK